jgi:lysophospholipase
MQKTILRLIIVLSMAVNLNAAPIKEYFYTMNPDLTLRVVKVESFAATRSQEPRNVIIFLPGRASFYEKNQDFALIVAGHTDHITQQQQPPIKNPFKELNADVWVIDYRAHGKSGGRLAVNDQRCHIGDFQDYLDDLHTILTQQIIPSYQNQPVRYYLMGASMGGHLALRYVQDYSHSFAKVFLVAPMLDFKTGSIPKWLARLIVKGSCLIGLGQKYAIGYGDWNLAKEFFNRQKSHHNRQAFDDTLMLLKNNPHLITSGPTNAWVSAAFNSGNKLMNPNTLKNVAVPVVMFAASDDNQVENKAMHEAHQNLQQCSLTTIEGAWHNLLKESDPYRVVFLQKLADAFKSS